MAREVELRAAVRRLIAALQTPTAIEVTVRVADLEVLLATFHHRPVIRSVP